MAVLGNGIQFLCRQSGPAQQKLDASPWGMGIQPGRVREAAYHLMSPLFPDCSLTSSQTSPSLGGGDENKKAQTHNKALSLRAMTV